MSIDVRGAAKINYGGGIIEYSVYSPDIPYENNEDIRLTEVTRLCLMGNISVTPVKVRVVVPEGMSHYQILGEVDPNSSPEQPVG